MAPFKSLLQTGFMMWMSGNSINIFSIMITAMIVMNTTKSFFTMNNGATRDAIGVSLSSRSALTPSVTLLVLIGQRLRPWPTASST